MCLIKILVRNNKSLLYVRIDLGLDPRSLMALAHYMDTSCKFIDLMVGFVDGRKLHLTFSFQFLNSDL